jgi:putative hydrolase of the HAD superfamily
MINSSQAPATVFIDADNTLWDTDSIFAEAQLKLLGRVEAAAGVATDAQDRLTYVRDIDQAIAERHHARLRYPPKLLVRGLEAALSGLQADRAARTAWRGSRLAALPDSIVAQIEEDFFAELSRVPEVRPGVYEGLSALRRANTVVLVVTEGPRLKVEKTASLLGLDNLVSRIIEGPKRPELYRRVLRLAGTPQRAFVIGDQLDRDTAPAKAAGLKTIYFPGKFRPRWTPEEALIQPDYTISNFLEVPSIVLDKFRTKKSASG